MTPLKWSDVNKHPVYSATYLIKPHLGWRLMFVSPCDVKLDSSRHLFRAERLSSTHKRRKGDTWILESSATDNDRAASEIARRGYVNLSVWPVVEIQSSIDYPRPRKEDTDNKCMCFTSATVGFALCTPDADACLNFLIHNNLRRQISYLRIHILERFDIDNITTERLIFS